MTKTCSRCKLTKSIEEFHKDKNKKYGVNGYCKLCAIEKANIWTKNNPEKAKDSSERNRYKRHNITKEMYLEILAKQNNTCAICKEIPLTSSELHIDHNHKCCPSTYSCGKCIRGLLCKNCNFSLGLMRENKDFLKSMLYYLGV